MMSDISIMVSVTNKFWIFRDVASTYKEIEIKLKTTVIIYESLFLTWKI